MLIGGVALGLIVGLLLGGRLERLADVRLRLLPLLFVAVIVRFGTESLLGLRRAGWSSRPGCRCLRSHTRFCSLTLWFNRGYPGLALAFVGVASNAVVIFVNGGYMPVWMPAYAAAGFEGPLTSALHVPLTFGTTPEFFLHLGPLGDLIPLPVPLVRNVASVGDLFLTSGLAFFLFATLVRVPPQALAELDEEWSGAVWVWRAPASRLGSRALPRWIGRWCSGRRASGWRRPRRLRCPTEAAVPRRPWALSRIREHPYVRLALNGSFSALWTGQLISLFGDRVNQLALIAFVFEITDSPAAVALTFLISTLPNLLFSPIAGTFVDRWDNKQVLVVSDILRASLVLLVPVAILINVWLAYPLVFLVTTVSIFFRPASVAILPRIVEERDLLAANSAMWVGETIAESSTTRSRACSWSSWPPRCRSRSGSMRQLSGLGAAADGDRVPPLARRLLERRLLERRAASDRRAGRRRGGERRDAATSPDRRCSAT